MVGDQDSKSLIPHTIDEVPRVPRVRFDPVTHASSLAPPSDADRDLAARAFRDAYLAALAEFVPGIERSVHVALADGMSARDGRPVHGAFLVWEHVALADAVARQSYAQPQYLDHVVLVGADVPGTLDPDGVRLLAALDLGTMVESLYPIEADGPVASLIPALVRMAGAMVLACGRIPLPDDGVRRAATSRLYAELGIELYGSTETDPADVARDHPAIAHMAEAIARRATAEAATMVVPADMLDLVDAVHGVVGDAVGALGCQVLS